MGNNKDASCSIMSSVYGISVLQNQGPEVKAQDLDVMIRNLHVLDCDTLVGEKGKQFYQIHIIKFGTTMQFLGQPRLCRKHL